MWLPESASTPGGEELGILNDFQLRRGGDAQRSSGPAATSAAAPLLFDGSECDAEERFLVG
jgi:hypothetical protein